MLFKYLEHLSKKRVILASGSPRRKEILENLNLKFEVIPSTFEEKLRPHDFPDYSDYVIATALGKMQDIADKEPKAEMIIAADTMVVLRDEVLGKPHEQKRAKQMLRRLSGKTHQVYTGVAIIWPSTNVVKRFCEVTDVTFTILDEENIDGYIATGEPLDKAGGYGIQGKGGAFIEKIDGDFYNVMGLPLCKFAKEVKEYYDLKLSVCEALGVDDTSSSSNESKIEMVTDVKTENTK